MDDVISHSQLPDLEKYIPVLQNFGGQEFSYLQLGEAIWCADDGISNGALAFGFDNVDANLRREHLKTLWNTFTHEFFTLVCTKDKKYSKVRRRIEGLKGHPTALVVGAVAGAIGATVGLSAGILTPFVALLLHGMVSLGANTFCTYVKETEAKQ